MKQVASMCDEPPRGITQLFILIITILWTYIPTDFSIIEILQIYISNFFFRGRVRWDWVHLVRWPLPGLLYQPQMMMMIMMMNMEQLVEWELAGQTEVLWENLPQLHFVHHKWHMTWPGLEPGPPAEKPVTNRLSYGTALFPTDLWSII
jgi:hypothetical protein